MKIALPLRVVCAAVFLTTSTFISADILDHWTKRSEVSINRVRYCGGMFVGVGPSGTIVTSRDGKTWTPRTSGTTRDLKGVAYGLYRGISPAFVIVGRETILVSSNAVTWEAVPVTNGCILNDISSSGLMFVAVGAQNDGASGPSAMYFPKISGGGSTWGEVKLAAPGAPGTPANFYGIAYGNGRFVGIGDIITGLWSTANGSSWTFRKTTFEYTEGCAYGNGAFVVVGQEGPPLYSTDGGTTWGTSLVDTNSPSSSTNYYVGADITFGDGRFVAIGGIAGLLVTTNGTNWSIRSSPPGLSIAYGAGTFVSAGFSTGIWQSDPVIRDFSIRQPSADHVEISVSKEADHSLSVEASTNLFEWTEVWRTTNSGIISTQFVDWPTNGMKRFFRAVIP